MFKVPSSTPACGYLRFAELGNQYDLSGLDNEELQSVYNGLAIHENPAHSLDVPLSMYTMHDLKQQCRQDSLPLTGTKNALIQRIREKEISKGSPGSSISLAIAAQICAKQESSPPSSISSSSTKKMNPVKCNRLMKVTKNCATKISVELLSEGIGVGISEAQRVLSSSVSQMFAEKLLFQTAKFVKGVHKEYLMRVLKHMGKSKGMSKKKKVEIVKYLKTLLK